MYHIAPETWRLKHKESELWTLLVIFNQKY